MRNTKRELPLFSMYDHTGMERHLEEMAVQGWMLEKTTGFGWVYRRCEARRVRYAVTYFPKASAYEPGPSEDKQIFQDYCAQAGWELVSDAAQMQIFRTEAENPLPIETRRGDPGGQYPPGYETQLPSLPLRSDGGVAAVGRAAGLAAYNRPHWTFEQQLQSVYCFLLDQLYWR